MDDTLNEPVGIGQMQPIFEAVGRRYRIPPRVIRGAGKTATALEARQVSCWLGTKVTRLSNAEISETVGRGRTSMGQAIARVERLRRDEPFMLDLTDSLLTELRNA